MPGLLPSYLIALVPTLAMIAGLILSSRRSCTTPSTPGTIPTSRPSASRFDAASPYPWALAAAVRDRRISGLRALTWTWVGHAWDGATSVAREKGIAA
jgi:branched-chain amino acid transport system permease protein